MHDLAYDVKCLAERNRDGSYATQANRKNMLMLMANQLVDLGYRQLRAQDLKGRHVNKLLALWKEQGLSGATIRNRLAALRYWEEKIGKRGVLPKLNTSYGLAPRQFVARVSKAKTVSDDVLSQVKDPYVRLSLELQRAFGLRREESIKFQVNYADQRDHLTLKPSWTKGGRAREIPVRTPVQRELLDRIRAFLPTKDASLIPAHLRYVDQLRKYEYWTAKVGLDKMHGLRHFYAQQRYLELAGFACPVAAGPKRADMTDAQREADYDARLIISAELGHCRPQIVAAYIGT